MDNKITPQNVSGLLKEQQDILAIQMTIRAMLVFMTSAKNGKAYDEEMIRKMRQSLLTSARRTANNGITPEELKPFFEGVERSIREIFDDLAPED